MSLSLHVDRPLVPAGAEAVRFVVCRLVAPARPPGWERPPASIGFCVDRSGSMSGAKLSRAKLALIGALARLGPRDRFAIVAFDDEAQVLAAGLAATKENVEAAVRRVRAIEVGGGTNLSAGWLLAAELEVRALQARERLAVRVQAEAVDAQPREAFVRSGPATLRAQRDRDVIALVASRRRSAPGADRVAAC